MAFLWSRRWRVVLGAGMALGSGVATAGYREESIVDFMERMREGELAVTEARLGGLHESYLNTSVGRDRRLVSLALGVQYLERNPRLALQYLTSAELACREGEPLLPIARYYLAQARLLSGGHEEALSIASALLETDVGNGWAKLLYGTVIEAAFGAGNYDKLVDAFDEYTKSFSFSRRQETLAHLAAVALEKKGDLQRATEVLEELARGYPTTAESRWAFARLIQLACDNPKTPGPRYHYSTRLLLHLARNAILGTGLRELIVGLIERPVVHEDGSVRTMTLAEKSKFLFKAQFYKEALEATRQLYEQERLRPASADLPDVVFDLGRVYLRLWEPMSASRYFSQFLADYPRHPLTARALEHLGDALRNAGLPKAAAENYAAAAAQKDSRLLRWQHFWNVYRSRDYAQALRLLEQPNYVQPRAGDDLLTVAYWYGRVLERLGRKAEADAKFAEILATSAESYYANLIAAVRPDLVERRRPPGVAAAETPPALGLAAKLLKTPVGDGRPSAQASSLRLVDDLLHVGLTEAAKMQLASLNWTAFGQEESFAAVSRLALMLDDYNPTRRIRYTPFSALRSMPTGWWDYTAHQSAHAGEWKVYFPLAFEKLVTPIATRIRLNPFLVLSIMRAESFYNKDARSGVGAQGLMQIMPYTAMKIAQLINDQNFEAVDLAKPEVNIGYGSYYLDKLLRYYGDNPFVAAAAYNGGPIAVNQWLGSCDDCAADEFVESIQYRETRRYVREVMRNYAQYLRIYTGQQALAELPPMPAELPDGEEIF